MGRAATPHPAARGASNAERRPARAKTQAPPSTERGRRTRQALRDAAEHVFAEMGFYRASITDITRRAGTSQGAFYLYFGSKEDAFFEVMRFHSELIHATGRRARAGATDPLDAERLAFENFFALVIERPQIYRIVRQAEFVDPALFREHYMPNVIGYAKALQAAMSSGQVRRMDPEALAFCLFGIADFVGMRWPYWTGKPVPRKVFDSVMELIRHGMAPDTPARPTAEAARPARPGRSRR